MAYTINKTDGSVLSTVADGQVDQLSTDLILIGKNFSGFGESLNENFVKLLENFADTAEPIRAIRGQIWFDSSELKLKVYNGVTFQPVSSATISSTQPDNLGVGDLWFNDVDRQLYFYDGTNIILLGPDFSASQGLSGLRVGNILDTLNQNRVITYLYTNGLLLGIFAKDTFTPKLPVAGFVGSIIPGFNAGALPGFKFNVTATNAESLGNQPAAAYLRRDTDNIINGQLTITSNRGLLIGDSQQAQLLIINGNIQISNDSEDRNISLRVKRNINVDEAIGVDTVNQRLNFYVNNPESTTSIGGSVNVAGNLTINGSLIINDGDVTVVKTSELVIEDKLIILAETGDSSFNSSIYADGGGIILRGTPQSEGGFGDHEWTYDNANTAWLSSEHIMLSSGKKIFIKDDNGFPREVLTVSSLGNSVTSILGVTEFGTQVVVNVGPVLQQGEDPVPFIKIENNRISTERTDQNLEFFPNGNGNVALIGNPRIIGVASPISPNDVATKQYVDIKIETRNIVLTLNINTSGGSVLNDAGIIFWLAQIAPPNEYRTGTLARILCSITSNSASSFNINTVLNPPTLTEFITPDAPGSPVPGGTGNAVSAFNFTTATLPSQGIDVFREVRTFVVKQNINNILFWDTP